MCKNDSDPFVKSGNGNKKIIHYPKKWLAICSQTISSNLKINK